MSLHAGGHNVLGEPSKFALEENQREFVGFVMKDLKIGYKHNKRSIEALAYHLKISDKTVIKELTELAIVNVAREIASTNETIQDKFERIVQLYNDQVILSHRTSESVLLQQYSTPAPIAYLMGIFCGLHELKPGEMAFEPSAGNGLLTVAGKPENIIVNEVAYERKRNLKTQGFAEVTNQDASKPFPELKKKFAAVITNPPFGLLETPVHYDSFPIKVLDHLMSLRALDTMKDNGRAAFIIGGHNRFDKRGRYQKGKNRIYFNYLYRHYNVMDIIQIEGKKLYTRQGTGFPTRLILVAGRKKHPEGNAPLKNDSNTSVVDSFPDLFDRVMYSYNQIEKEKMIKISEIERRARELRRSLGLDGELGAVYKPASNACIVLNTQVPDSMSFETQSALARIKKEIGGDIDNFVRHRLGYPTRQALCQAFSAEQIDAIAMAIYNIEAREQGMIIGDQTGIGKGRIAAAMIRYGVKRGLKPVFITEKANLFSDIYRDLAAIGSGHLRPFIINSKETKTDIKDEDGEIVYEALPPNEQKEIFETNEVPARFDFEVATYSQFNSPKRKETKPNYLTSIVNKNILILDESHNASGSGNTGTFMQSIVELAAGVTFLSATFAKQPGNMPIYAEKTAIGEANMSKDALVRAINRGGVALQEILSSQLVAEGQMIRRERSFEGIEVNYIQLDEYEEQHRRTSDAITNILRYIIAFQEGYVDKKIDEMDKDAASAGEQVAKRGGTSQAGVDSLPYFSKVFNVINQMLFSIKAEAVADRAIMRLKEGKKPVIAFSSTMGSFIENMENENGGTVGDGDVIRLDFAEVLRKGLEGILRYTVYDVDGNGSYGTFDPRDLGQEAFMVYEQVKDEINRISSGISISPIDVIVQKLERAGYSVAEVTGRKYKVIPHGATGTVQIRKKINTNDAFRKFNNNEIDVLLINQAGSTGASAHAIVTSKVPKEEVKQRVMIVLQAELDINIEVQKRGRINRTGQILKPIYDYVTSAIPAEKRLMMMLQKKLKSLDANTTSNQKQSTSILDVPDFLNKYGDKIVREYLNENPEVDKLLGEPLSDRFSPGGDSDGYVPEAATKVSGRVAVLSTKMQTEFYNEMTDRYNDYVEYLKQIGEYDLEVEALDLKAKTLESNIIKMGKGGESAFGEDSILEKIEANILKKPFRTQELEKLIQDALNGRTAEEHKKEMLDDLTKDFEGRVEQEIKDTNIYYDNLIKRIPEEKKIKKLIDDTDAFLDAMEQRRLEIEELRKAELDNLDSGKSGKMEYIRRIINFYTIGRLLAYPLLPKEDSENAIAVCLGVVINKKKKNPYAKSAVKIRIAVASSIKYVTVPASHDAAVDKIISLSHDLTPPTHEELMTAWESEIKSRTKDRGIRYVVVGNLLQAFDEAGEDGGKLASYTTIDGETKKGILMPEDWRPKDLGKQKVTVPIMKGLKIIQSLVNGHVVNASDNISFLKMDGAYKIIVPAARSKGGAIYMDEEIWPLIKNNKFEMASDKMVAILPDYNIEQLAQILQENHSTSLQLNLNQLSLIDKEKTNYSTRKPIVVPPDENDAELERIRIIEIEAKALALRLKLAA